MIFLTEMKGRGQRTFRIYVTELFAENGKDAGFDDIIIQSGCFWKYYEEKFVWLLCAMG